MISQVRKVQQRHRAAEMSRCHCAASCSRSASGRVRPYRARRRNKRRKQRYNILRSGPQQTIQKKVAAFSARFGWPAPRFVGLRCTPRRLSYVIMTQLPARDQASGSLLAAGAPVNQTGPLSITFQVIIFSYSSPVYLVSKYFETSRCGIH